MGTVSFQLLVEQLKMKLILKILLSLGLCSTTLALEGELNEDREGKILPVFQVVRFPNDRCSGTTRNGTCYTAEECSSIGGLNEGSCASGFGVCCVISLACGGESSSNNSYIVQSGVTSLTTSPCTYTICPNSKDICRIRYDFTTNVLAPQLLGEARAAATANTADILLDDSIGACQTDTMSISSPGFVGSPVICGTNSGQHMILDSDGSRCQTATFDIGALTTTTRSWDIYVTQYTCGQEDEAGAPGCLQYFTGVGADLKNFGWDTQSGNSATATIATQTHLQNQHYEICIRRESGYCHICYHSFSGAAGQSSFGLSVTAADAAMGVAMHDTECIADYLEIPFGGKTDVAASTAVALGPNSRFCGRYLATDGTAADTSATVCSRVYPFRVGVHYDKAEVCTISVMSQACENNVVPGGIVGFHLTYTQVAC